MSGVITKIHLSPTAAGKLFQKACALEKEIERLQSRVSENCDAPTGWIAPDKYKAACESKMEFFKTIKELREQNEKLQARVAELECMVRAFRACVDIQMVPSWGSPCHDQIHALVGKNTEEGT